MRRKGKGRKEERKSKGRIGGIREEKKGYRKEKEEERGTREGGKGRRNEGKGEEKRLQVEGKGS